MPLKFSPNPVRTYTGYTYMAMRGKPYFIYANSANNTGFQIRQFNDDATPGDILASSGRPSTGWSGTYSLTTASLFGRSKLIGGFRRVNHSPARTDTATYGVFSSENYIRFSQIDNNSAYSGFMEHPANPSHVLYTIGSTLHRGEVHPDGHFQARQGVGVSGYNLSTLSTLGLFTLSSQSSLSNEHYRVYRFVPGRQTTSSIEIGDIIPFLWSGNYTIWSPLGDIGACKNKLVKFRFPRVSHHIDLPSEAIAFHPIEGILLMRHHIAKYDPSTLELSEVKEHNLSYLKENDHRYGEFTPNGRYFVGFSLASSHGYDVNPFTSSTYQTVVYTVSPTGSLILMSKLGDILSREKITNKPLNLGILGYGVYSNPEPVEVLNDTTLPIGDLEITVDNNTLDDVELSETADPFEPKKRLLLTDTIMPQSSTTFFVRVRINPDNPNPIRHILINAEAQYRIT